ncbi:carbonic anhydrase [Candidatus Acidianus copahuensis]|nr:carbonic anhydrase [Candidatus Acidianus copahuensis]
MGKKLVISCMDYRLTQTIRERSEKEDAYVFRNAGANVNGLRKALSQIDAEEVIFMPHNDCAAMKLVYRVIKEGIKVEDEIMKSLIDQFNSIKFSTTNELEKENVKIQAKILSEIFPKSKITIEFIDVNSLKWPERKPEVQLLRYNTKYEEEINGTYIIQSNSKESVIPDIQIANLLGLKIIKDEL